MSIFQPEEPTTFERGLRAMTTEEAEAESDARAFAASLFGEPPQVDTEPEPEPAEVDLARNNVVPREGNNPTGEPTNDLATFARDLFHPGH